MIAAKTFVIDIVITFSPMIKNAPIYSAGPTLDI
tara:strand:- start:3369 stop:3470 length:102 start_codon:yes stop_codon:yes gene_type:complete